MARGINKVILIGNLGKDPELRYMPSGGAVVSTSLATGEKWTDKQTGEIKERTEWHNVVFFNKVAEVVSQYLKKGSRIYIEGRLRTRKWQDKEGTDRYTTEVVAGDMQMLGGNDGQQSNRQQSTSEKYREQTRSNVSQATNNPPPADEFEDDDIPF